MTQHFDYHRAVAPMMWVLVCVATVELVVVHLLLAMWRPWVAAGLSVVSLGGIAWLVGVIRSFRRLPVLIEGDRLVMRAGSLATVEVPRAAVAGLRERWDAAALKRAGVRKLSLIAWPNVVIDLDPPLPGDVAAVAHRLDDPAAFRAALDRWRAEPQRVGEKWNR